MWRERRDRDDFSEYGSLFDDAEPTQNIDEVAEGDSDAITFGAGTTGNLPHWTDPPTGEVPRLDAEGEPPAADESEELDVWSSFSSESPVWQEDEQVEAQAAETADPRTSQQRRATDDPKSSGQHRRVSGESDVVTREPSRITIGTDPSGIPRRAPAPTGRRRGAPQQATSRSRSAGPPKSGRDMPVAIAVGLLIAAFFGATLSSKSAELNALASTTTVDIYRHVVKRAADDAHYVRASRGFTTSSPISDSFREEHRILPHSYILPRREPQVQAYLQLAVIPGSGRATV
jgi:hypothetical protein